MRFTTTIFILFCLNQLFGQSNQSLVDQAYDQNNPNKSIELLSQIQKPLSFSDSLRAKYFLTYGIAYGKMGMEDSAIFFLKKSMAISEPSNFHFLTTRAGNAMGLTLFHAGKYEEAISNYQQVLKLAEENKFREEESTILGNMGGVYFQMDEYVTAIDYSLKSLSIARELNDTEDLAYGHLRLAVVYEEIDSLEKSISHNSKARKYAEPFENYVLLTYIEKTIGNIHKKLGQLDSAFYHHGQALEYAKLEGEQENIASATLEVARIHIEMGELNMAEGLAQEILNLSLENTYPLQSKQANEVLYQIAVKREEFKKALNYRNRYILINDSLNAVDTKERIAELEIKYETTKKEKEIVEANIEIERKQRFQIFLMVILGIVILFSVIAILLVVQRSKLRNALLSQEIDTLRFQIQSIFPQSNEQIKLNPATLNKGLYKPLSEREVEILEYAITEKTNREIAEAVFLSINTVKFHLKSIYEKLGVSNRTEALEKLVSKAK